MKYFFNAFVMWFCYLTQSKTKTEAGFHSAWEALSSRTYIGVNVYAN
jgi:hypothetical protein